MKNLLLAVSLACLSSVASAQDSSVLASYGTNNGSLPPEYAWDNEVTIHADGKLIIRHCTGYETEGPACKTRKGKVTEDAMAAIRDAALASDLAANPASPTDYPLVGGDAVWGSVHVDGQDYVLLSDPSEADASRVQAVLDAIAAAIPGRFEPFMSPD